MEEITEQKKLEAATSVVANSVLHGWTDIAAVRRILPQHYEVKESKSPNAIHCKSEIGIRKSPYTVYPYPQEPDRAVYIDDAEDDEHWGYIMQAFKKHFGERFLEVYHNTCFCHVDFTIHLTERK